MRSPAWQDRAVQVLVAGLCLAPLLWAFWGHESKDASGAAVSPLQSVYSGACEPGGISPREILISALGRSALVGAGATLLALLLGIPAGWALSARRRAPWILALCALPLAFPPSAAVSGWLQFFAPGDVSSAFQKLLPGLPVPGPFFSLPGVAFLLGLGLWPIVAFETWPAFTRARGEAHGAALLAASPARAFLRIVLPMSRGELAAGALLVFVLAASDFTVSSLLLARTLPVEVHDCLAAQRLASAAWTALPLVLLVVAVTAALTWGRRITAEHGPSTPSEASSTPRLAYLALAAGLAGGFVIPLLGCLAGVLPSRSLGAAVGAGLPALWVSLRLAASVALLAVLAGALRTVCWPRTTARPLLWAGLLLLAVPGSFLAGGLLAAESEARAWVTLGSLMLAWGGVLRFAYLPLRLAEEGLRSLDPALLEAAELAGHSRVACGLGIALPLVWRHLLAAGGLVFVLMLGELPLADQLSPPGAVPLSVWLFNQQHYGYSEAVFALSLLAGVASVLALALAVGANRLARGKAGEA
jgi:ABC-type Fe3+ transport system permease subunit